MRVLITVTMPNDVFNAAVRDGSAGAKLKKILDAIKPEAVYFTDHNGCRSALLVVNITDGSQIPSIAEPWFLTFNATLDVKVAMTPEDLAKAGLEKLGKTWG